MDVLVLKKPNTKNKTSLLVVLTTFCNRKTKIRKNLGKIKMCIGKTNSS